MQIIPLVEVCSVSAHVLGLGALSVLAVDCELGIAIMTSRRGRHVGEIIESWSLRLGAGNKSRREEVLRHVGGFVLGIVE